MLKLVNILESEEKSILSIKDKKILSLIHKKVWKEHDLNANYNAIEELYNFDEELLEKLYVFLKDIMGFLDEHKIEYYIKLFINNFQEDGDYNKLTYHSENKIPTPNNYQLAVAKSQGIPTLLVLDKRERWDRDMHIFYDIVNDIYFQVGTEKATLGAIRDMLRDRYYNFYDAYQHNGGLDGITQFFFIDDIHMEMLASEYAEHMENDMRDQDVLHMTKHESHSEKIESLVDRYESLEDGEGDPMLNTGVPPKVEMDDIMDTLREAVREIIYEEQYNKMDNYLDDWLREHGYLTEDKWGSPEFSKQYLNKWDEPDVSKLPDWLNFDLDELVDHHTDIDRAGELSNIDEYYDVETINGDTYYIIEIDY